MNERIKFLFELETAQALTALDRLRGKIIATDLNMKKMNTTTQLATANLMRMSQGGIVRAAQTTRILGKETKTTSSGLGGMASKAMMAMVGLAALMKIIRMMVEAVKETAKAFREFELRMAEVSTIVQDTEHWMGTLKAGVRSMSMEFGKSSSDLARGLYDILSASVPVEDSLQMLRVSARAATAGITSVEKSVDALTSVMNGYNLEVSQMYKVSDIMFKAVIRGKFRYEDLTKALGYVVPIAAQVGIKFEEIAAAISSATRQGQHVDMVARGLALSIQNIIKPSEGAVKAAEEMGLSLSQASLRVYGLQGFMEKLAEATEGNAGAISKIIPNMRSYRVAMVLAARDAEEFGIDVDLMTDSLGETELAFGKIADTVDMSRNILTEYKNEMNRLVGESTTGIEMMGIKWDMFKTSFLEFYLSGMQSIDPNRNPVASFVAAVLPGLGGVIAGITNTSNASKDASDQANEYVEKQLELIRNPPEAKSSLFDTLFEGGDTDFSAFEELNGILEKQEEYAIMVGTALVDLRKLDAPVYAVKQVAGDFQDAQSAILDTKDSLAYWEAGVLDAADAVKYYSDSIDIVFSEMGKLSGQIDKMTQKLKENTAQLPVDYMNHYVALMQEESKYQDEVNKEVDAGSEGFGWYTEEMKSALTVVREYENQTKSATEAQNEFNFALARNRIETMKIQLLGMMRRRGNTRSEMKTLKSLSIERTELQIIEAEKKLLAEENANNGIVDSGKAAYEKAKVLIDSITREHSHSLWLIKDTRKEDLEDLEKNIQGKKDIWANFNTELGILIIERNLAMKVEHDITMAMHGEESVELAKLILQHERLVELQSHKVPEAATKEELLAAHKKGGFPAFVKRKNPELWYKMHRSGIPGYPRGTSYVPSDGIYKLERGEQVISNSNNGNGDSGVHIGSVTIQVKSIEDISSPDKLAAVLSEATDRRIISTSNPRARNKRAGNTYKVL